MAYANVCVNTVKIGQNETHNAEHLKKSACLTLQQHVGSYDSLTCTIITTCDFFQDYSWNQDFEADFP